MSGDTFLSRWSRRKQQARKPEPLPENVAPSAGSAAPVTAPETAAPSDVAAPPPASGEEAQADLIARLPSLDDLTADTDLSVFLQQGVPEGLRNAALRRMWSLDPKVRDYLSEAREYAYDWNTPGGVPGSAPLPASKEIAHMAARMVGGVGIPGDEDPEGRSADSVLAPGARARSQDGEQLSPAQGTSAVETPVVVRVEAQASGDDAGVSRDRHAPETLAESPLASAGPGRDAEVAAITAEPDLRSPAGQPRRHGGAIPV